MREGSWRGPLVREVLAGGPADVLDLGCGTGTLTIELAAAAPDARVSASTATRRSSSGRGRRRATPPASTGWRRSATSFPSPANSFDRVVSTLVFHHLGPLTKRAVLREIRRVLRPGGRLHIADWGRPQDP